KLGALDASRKTRTRVVISHPPREPLPVAAIIVLLQSRCALRAVAALGPRQPRRDSESRAPSRAQRAQARLQVLVATHDSTAALVDEELDLEVDGGPLVVGAQPEVPAVADDQLTARERVADLRRGAAVDVGAVENRDDTVGGVDRGAIGRAHLAVELPPGLALLGPVRQPLHGLDLVGIGQGPGIEHIVAEARHERHEHGIVEVSPGLGEAERTRHVDLRRGRHPPDRKSTRLNSSHVAISYAVFCLKKKNASLSRPAAETNTPTRRCPITQLPRSPPTPTAALPLQPDTPGLTFASLLSFSPS